MKLVYFVPEQVGERLKSVAPSGWETDAIWAKESGRYDASDLDSVADADFFIAGVEPITEEIFATAKKLKLVQRLGVGYDSVDLEAASRRGVPVAITPGANSVAVAEHAIMMILALYRGLMEADSGIKAGGWPFTSVLDKGTFELADKTVGIVGLGNIGRAFAKRARVFEAKLLYYDIRKPTPDFERDLGVTFLPLEELLSQSDVVTLHVPLTDLTRGMIGKKELESMKPTALLINTSRGGVVDEAALTEALEAGTIAGAGVDVFVDEPVNPSNPLLKAKNIVFTPHTAGIPREASARVFSEAMQNVLRVAEGQEPLNVVNR